MYSIDKSNWAEIAQREKAELKKKEGLKLTAERMLQDFNEYKEITGVESFYRFLEDSFEKVNKTTGAKMFTVGEYSLVCVYYEDKDEYCLFYQNGDDINSFTVFSQTTIKPYIV